MTLLPRRRVMSWLLAVLLPVALIVVAIVLASGAGVPSASVVGPSPSVGSWSNLPNFPAVDLGFPGNGAPSTGPLKLKRAVAVAYPHNGRIYILGGRHRPDGEDIGVRWIWEYNPTTNALAQKSALLDGEAYGDRYLATMAAAVLTGTSGPRIYAIGGVSMDSIVTATVRIYNPNTDTASNLTVADNWPANPARVPGGYAVYNNKLYVFGGHATKPSSQLFSDTWVFDPMQPAGSKWTQIAGANLSVARAYIAGATLDGYIYAIGGDVVVSSTVTPVRTVERLDPANPGAGWQAMAPLPYAKGDMGAWAYDTGSGYEIAGRIVVAGGGYPAPDAHAYIYDPAGNSWAYFADMLRPRRNYASTQLGGILYAWGGYNVSRGVQDGSNDSMKYDASGPPPPPLVAPTLTPVPSPTSCLANQAYTYTITSGATVVPGTTLVSPGQCLTCIDLVTLPFPVQLYGSTFTSMQLGTAGNIQMVSNSTAWINRCLPYANFSYTLMPYWDDLWLQGSGAGTYTSVSGSAPNRVFNVEWRGTNISFEVRLFEGSSNIEFIYGNISGSSTSTIGIQKDLTNYTQVSCNTAGITNGTKITFTLPACATTTSTPVTPVPTSTVTATPAITSTGTAIPTATSSATAMPTITSTPCTIVFTDVPVGSTFYPYVTCMACRGIINGYETGCESGNPCFRPQNDLTRGQLSKIVSNAAGFTEPATSQQYEDVAVGSTFHAYIWRLTVRGYVNGYACGGPGEPCGAGNLPYFRPAASASRGQISKIVVVSAGLPINTEGGPHFSDVAVGSTFYEWIETLFNAGAITGYPDGTFRPGNNATRGQTSKIVSEVFFPGCSSR